MVNQCVRIIDYMREFGSITSAEAMQELGVYRLASRICDLKKAGFKINSSIKSAKNRYGETVYFKAYSLSENGNSNVRVD